MKVVFVSAFFALCVLTTYTRCNFLSTNYIDDDEELDEITSLERVKRSPDAAARRSGGYRSPPYRAPYRAPRARTPPRVVRRPPSRPKVKTPVVKKKTPVKTPGVKKKTPVKTPGVKKKKPGKKTPGVKRSKKTKRISVNPGVNPGLNTGSRRNNHRGGGNVNKPKTILLILIAGLLATIHYII